MKRLEVIANIGAVSYDEGRDIYFIEFKAFPEKDSIEVPVAGHSFREMCAKINWTFPCELDYQSHDR